MNEVWWIDKTDEGFLLMFGDISLKLFSYKNNKEVSVNILCEKLNKIFKNYKYFI